MGRPKNKSSLDHLVEQFVNDTRYRIEETGRIYRVSDGEEIGYIRNGEARLRNKPYRYVTYGPGRHKLKVCRIMYRKFHGELKPWLVIDHKDDNSLNDSKDNLQQISQAKNVQAIQERKGIKNETANEDCINGEAGPTSGTSEGVSDVF